MDLGWPGWRVRLSSFQIVGPTELDLDLECIGQKGIKVYQLGFFWNSSAVDGFAGTSILDYVDQQQMN